MIEIRAPHSGDAEPYWNLRREALEREPLAFGAGRIPTHAIASGGWALKVGHRCADLEVMVLDLKGESA